MNNLTEEEQELLSSVEDGQWQSKLTDQRKQELQQYAVQHLNPKIHLDITMSNNDFEKLKSFALKAGISYQDFAENILHSYVEKNVQHG